MADSPRKATLEETFVDWIANKTLTNSTMAEQVRTMFAGASWADVVEMAARAPADRPDLDEDGRKCRIALYLLEGFRLKVAKEAREETARRKSRRRTLQ